MTQMDSLQRSEHGRGSLRTTCRHGVQLSCYMRSVSKQEIPIGFCWELMFELKAIDDVDPTRIRRTLERCPSLRHDGRRYHESPPSCQPSIERIIRHQLQAYPGVLTWLSSLARRARRSGPRP